MASDGQALEEVFSVVPLARDLLKQVVAADEAAAETADAIVSRLAAARRVIDTLPGIDAGAEEQTRVRDELRRLLQAKRAVAAQYGLLGAPPPAAASSSSAAAAAEEGPNEDAEMADAAAPQQVS